VVFVEWIASAPVEIELIAHLPAGKAAGIQYYNPPDVKPSPDFSRAALVYGSPQVFVSGLSARAAGDGEDQARDVFLQLKAILEQVHSDMRHLAKAGYYVSDVDASDMLNKVRAEYLDPQRPPAASKVTVHGVGHSARSLSVDMIAIVGSDKVKDDKTRRIP
jgi:enamine deaminase RidA (YjgF/YER057c/UK114 family)